MSAPQAKAGATAPRRRRRRVGVIPEWRSAWRLASVRMAALAAVFGLLPVDQQAAVLALLHIPPERVPAVVGLLFIAARVLSARKDG